MRTVNWDRIAPANGILFVIAFVFLREPPDQGDSRAEWTSYTLDKTKELKVSAIRFGLAFMAFHQARPGTPPMNAPIPRVSVA
jgi:hypothetical protein